MSQDPLRPHSHEPNPEPPGNDPSFRLVLPDGTEREVSVADLKALPATTVPNCSIVSTGHGTSGPFAFTGVTLTDFIAAYWNGVAGQYEVEVVSGDGFGTHLAAAELSLPHGRSPLLSYAIDGEPMSRRQGLVRLIVPGERDDALKQVKWVREITVVVHGRSSRSTQKCAPNRISGG
jgi:DMSO/TMAO reductase YedYZ molybdopterin-dependent catalytic subunit